MVYAGYVKVGPGKAQTGRVKLQIRHAGTGEAKFSLGEGKISTGSGFTGSVTKGCFASANRHSSVSMAFESSIFIDCSRIS